MITNGLNVGFGQDPWGFVIIRILLVILDIGGVTSQLFMINMPERAMKEEFSLSIEINVPPQVEEDSQ